jgi:hypothetical protein
MFEKLTNLAEQAATNASRRQFFGSVGRAAMLMAAAAGGLLALPAGARAAPRIRACDPFSSYACQGHNVGDFCDDQYYGRCAYLRGTTSCYCASKGPGPRG